MTGRVVLDRLLTRVLIDAECWLWIGTCDRGGYGLIKVQGRSRLVHRVAYEQIVGPIPDGLQLDHLCSRRACVNPAHLEPVTPRENVLRSQGFPGINDRKTECPRGHPYDIANTLTHSRSDGRTYRRCRECHRAASARNGAVLKAARLPEAGAA